MYRHASIFYAKTLNTIVFTAPWFYFMTVPFDQEDNHLKGQQAANISTLRGSISYPMTVTSILESDAIRQCITGLFCCKQESVVHTRERWLRPGQRLPFKY